MPCDPPPPAPVFPAPPASPPWKTCDDSPEAPLELVAAAPLSAIVPLFVKVPWQNIRKHAGFTVTLLLTATEVAKKSRVSV